jgi:hypothetical protein
VPDIIPFGYGQVLIPMAHAGVSRSAAITYGIDMNGSSGSAQMADKHLDDWEDAWATLTDSEVTAGPVRLAVGQADGTNVVYVGTVTNPGTSVGNRLPSNNALLITKQTARGGRRGRGRMYLPWVLAETSVSDVGVIDAATVVAYQTAADGWLTQIATAAGAVVATPMTLLHSDSAPGTQNPTPPGAPNEVLSLIVDNLVGSQRRRLAR